MRSAKEAFSTTPLQSGLDEHRWAELLECYCSLCDVQDLSSGGKTPHEATVVNHPMSTKTRREGPSVRQESTPRTLHGLRSFCGRKLERRRTRKRRGGITRERRIRCVFKKNEHKRSSYAERRQYHIPICSRFCTVARQRL